MKRGILILLFILLLACSVNAITVEYQYPEEGEERYSYDWITLMCQVIKNETEEINSVTFYFKNNESIEWHAVSETPEKSGDEYWTPIETPVNAIYTWNCLAVNNESNEEWGENLTFTIVETPPSPPRCYIRDNTNIIVNEDSGAWTLDSNMTEGDDWSNISCYDDDDDALTYTINSQTGSGGTFSLSNNDVLNFATDANATGTKIVVIGVSDGTSTIQISAQVIVSPVNDPPWLSSVIPNQNWSEDTTAKINLNEYFFDVDDPSLNYSYTFTSLSPINIDVTIGSNGSAVFTPDPDWTGTETLTFTAYDNANPSVTSNEILLTVQKNATVESNVTVNRPPNIDTVDPITNPTISVGESQTFKITKSDPDDDSMNVTWYVDGVIQEGKAGDSFIYTASIVGSFVIKVAVSDGQESDTNTWALTVKSAQAFNQTAPPAEEKTGENVTACGDGNCTGDEDQLSCCKDCGCPEGYKCNADTGTCRKESKLGNIILLAVVLGLFAGGAGVGLYLYKKKQEQEIFGGFANAPFETPPKTEEVKNEELIVKKPQEPVKEAAEEKPLKDTKTTSQVLLKNYIITNLQKGKSLEQIKEELRKAGWTEEQINDAYTAAQFDEAFS